MVTPMLPKPRVISLAQEYRDYKSNTYALNNLIGVDSRGLIETAIIGAPASVSDTHLFEQIDLFKAMENKDGSDSAFRMPDRFVVLADSGFTPKVRVATPFTATGFTSAGRNKRLYWLYNFRLSQIRVVSENVFARLKGLWTMLRSIHFGPEIASLVVHACYCLHNFLEKRGEPILSSWLRQPTFVYIEPTSVAFDTPTRASMTIMHMWQQRRIHAVSLMEWGWD